MTQDIINDIVKHADTPFIVIIGNKGVGKSYITRQVAIKRNEKYVEIKGDKEVIENLSSMIDLSEPTRICIYDYTEMSIQAINAMLKVAEEPPKNLFIVLHSRSNIIMETIKSRAYIYHVDDLSKNEVINFIKTQTMNMNLDRNAFETLYKACRTHGNVLDILEQGQRTEGGIKAIVALLDKIKQNLDTIKISNLLKIIDKLYNKKQNINLLEYLHNLICYSGNKDYPPLPPILSKYDAVAYLISICEKGGSQFVEKSNGQFVEKSNEKIKK